MTRALKWLAIGAGVILGLAAIAIGALLLWVDPNDYRDRLEELAGRQLGRPLEIAGPLDFKVFPWLSLEARQLSLGNPPGFGAEPFAKVASARVGVKLLPLLHKRLEVSRIAIDGLDLRLVKRGDGHSNWEDLREQDRKQAEGREAATRTSIAGLDLTGGALQYRDEATRSLTRLRDIELHTGTLGSGAPVPLDLSLVLDEGDGTSATRLALQATANLPTGSPRIELSGVRVRGERIPAAPKRGKKPEPKVPFELTASQLVLDPDAETLAPAKVEVTYGGLPLQASIRGERLFGERVLQGEFTVPRVAPRKVLPGLGVELPETPPGTLEAMQAKGAWRMTAKQLEISGLVASLDETTLRGRVAIDDLDAETPPLRFDLTADAVNVDRYFPPTSRTASAAAPAREEKPAELPREALAGLQARGPLRIGRFTVAGLAFSDVSTTLDAQGGLVKLGPTSAKLFGGGYQGMLTLDVRSSPARLALDEHVRDLDLGALMQASFDSKRLSGRIDGNAVLTARGDTDDALLKALSGRTDFDIRNGALEGVDLWYELRLARALWQREAPPARSGPSRTPFTALRGSGVLDHGLLRTDDLRAETEYVKVSGRGVIDIASTALDYRLTAELYKIPPEGAGAEMTAVRAAEIPLTITGTIADMKVRPDFNALIKGRVKEEVAKKVEEQQEKLQQKLEDKLGDKLGDKLKGLFGR